MSERRPRILVADDDAGSRQVMCDCLTHAGYEILLAENGEQAMALAETCHPDLAIVDIVMPEPSGPALVALLKELDPAMQVIVITAYGSIELAVESMRKGAFHFLAKPARYAQLLQTVADARSARPTQTRPGRMAPIADRWEEEFPVEGEPVSLRDLSDRERDVLDALRKGRTDQEIADLLDISVFTVRTHVRNILSKLGVKNRVQAAILWERYTRSRLP